MEDGGVEMSFGKKANVRPRDVIYICKQWGVTEGFREELWGDESKLRIIWSPCAKWINLTEIHSNTEVLLSF